MKVFTVTDEEEAKIEAWMATQPKQSYRGGGDCGYAIPEYVFSSNNVGDIFVVRNPFNGEELDLTRYDKW